MATRSGFVACWSGCHDSIRGRIGVGFASFGVLELAQCGLSFGALSRAVNLAAQRAAVVGDAVQISFACVANLLPRLDIKTDARARGRCGGAAVEVTGSLRWFGPSRGCLSHRERLLIEPTCAGCVLRGVSELAWFPARGRSSSCTTRSMSRVAGLDRSSISTDTGWSSTASFHDAIGYGLRSLNPTSGARMKQDGQVRGGASRRRVEKAQGRKVPGVVGPGGPDSVG